MEEKDIIERTAEHVRLLLSGEGSGHDWFHIERVRRTALAIAAEEDADLLITELAALLHDVADWKFAGGDHEAGPRQARQWLESLGAAPASIDHICEIIAGLSYKGAGVETPMRTLEGQCVQDADRLDAIGAIGGIPSLSTDVHRRLRTDFFRADGGLLSQGAEGRAGQCDRRQSRE